MGEQIDHGDHDSRRDQPQCIHSGARRDARSDRPEQVQQIQRILDCGAEADDGQCAHHTKGDDHVGTDGQCDHAGKHAHSHQRYRKAAGVYYARIEFAVDQINKDAQRQRRQQRHRKLRRIVLDKGIQDRFFDKVFCAHGSLYSFSLRFRSSIQTRADMRSYRSTAHTWKRQSAPAHGAGGCPARSAADTL